MNLTAAHPVLRRRRWEAVEQQETFDADGGGQDTQDNEPGIERFARRRVIGPSEARNPRRNRPTDQMTPTGQSADKEQGPKCERCEIDGSHAAQL